MSRTVVLPLGDYPTGTRVIPEFAIADSVTVGSMELQRNTTATPTIWPNVSTTVRVALEISLDGRVTWQGAGEFTAEGGIALNRDGSQLATTKAWWGWPAGTGRFVRGSVTVANGPLRTTGTIELI